MKEFETDRNQIQEVIKTRIEEYQTTVIKEYKGTRDDKDIVDNNQVVNSQPTMTQNLN